MNLIRTEVLHRVGYIILNRPEKRNALSSELVAELKWAFEQMDADPQVKVIVLKAEGKVFCAGADLAYIQTLQRNTFEENLDDSHHLKSLFHQIYQLSKIVIAQVQGHAIAGGCGLASVCDLIFAVPEAKFGYTEVKIGFIPAIVMVFLLRKIGEGRAKELLLSGNLIEATTAREYGLVNFIVEPDQLDQEVRQYAERMCNENSGQSLMMTKQLIAHVQDLSLERALDTAADANAHARATEDCKRGIASFLNKESLTW